MTIKRRGIVLLVTGLMYGGAETQLVRLAVELRARGWTVHVVSMRPPRAFVPELRAAGVGVTSLEMTPGVPDPRALYKLVTLLQTLRPALLCSFLFHANLLGRSAGRLAGVPVVVSSVRNESFGGAWRDRAMRLTDALADVTTTNSERVARQLVARGVVSARRLRVIPNGVLLPTPGESREAVRRALSVGPDVFLWLAAGRLQPQKDYPTLLAAFGELSGLPVKLVIAGEGAERGALEARAQRLGLEKRVTFLGFREDVPDLLKAADALVLSSSWEGLPNVMMEALAAAKPVVATEVGGAAELLGGGRGGFLVPPRNPSALADAVKRLVRLPESARKRMGEAGRAHIEATYALGRVVDLWEELYTELLARKGIF